MVLLYEYLRSDILNSKEMTKQEQLLLKTVIDSLIKSTNPGWTKGDFDQWTDYAKSMRASINSSVKILETISHQDFELNDPIYSQKLESLKQGQNIEKQSNPEKAPENKPWN